MTTYAEKLKALKAALSRDPSDFIGSIVRYDSKSYFKDGTVGELMAEGFPVEQSVRAWAESYTGSNTFAKDVARKIAGGKKPSVAQLRGLLNVAVKDVQEKDTGSSGVEETVEPMPEPKHPCFVCGEKFHTVREAADHRVRTHKGAASFEPDRPATPKAPEPPRVIKCRACDYESTSWADMREHRKEHYKPLFDGVPQSGLDLTTIPEGRYAVPNLTGSDYIFLSVKKVHNDQKRSKKFRYGWVTYGEEEVKADTLEVRQWRGDTKELIGEQRPGETYRGDHLDEWKLILKDPVTSTKLFGVIHKRCGRCGKGLTDPDSRRLAIGPECIKHYSDPNIFRDAPSMEELTERMMKLRGGETTPSAFLKPSPFTTAGFTSVTPDPEPEPEPEPPAPEPAKKLLAPPGW